MIKIKKIIVNDIDNFFQTTLVISGWSLSSGLSDRRNFARDLFGAEVDSNRQEPESHRK